MKASLVSATSLVALLAFEAGPAMAGPLVNLSDAAGTCTNSAGASSCTLTFFALPGQTASSTNATQSQTVTATYISSNTLTFAVTFTKGNTPYSGTKVNTSLNPPTTVVSSPYNFTGAASAGTSGASASTAGSFQVQVSNNTAPSTSQTSIVTLQGTTVAPIENTTSGNAGNVLVGTSQSTSVTVQNTGHGNKASGGASSSATNLNGSLSSISGVFAGTGGTLGSGTGLADSASQGFAYTFAPTIRGTTSTSVTANFSNGDPTGGNASNTVAATVTGTGVAPVQSVAITNAAGSGGGTANTGSLGNILVGQTASATVTVSNVGDGNKDTKQPTSVSNLNGSITNNASGVFSGTAGKSVSLNDSTTVSSPTTSAAFTYVYAPTVRSSGATQSVTVTSAFSNGNSNNTNSAQTVTSAITGVAVAPVDGGVTGGTAGNVLVNNNSKTVTVTTSNTGDGNTSGLGSVSNLNGTIGSSSGLFSGAGGAVSIGDTSTATTSYVFTPTQIGASSTSVSANFSDGKSDGTNASHSTNATITGTGVAPIQNQTITNNGNPGSVVNTGNVGYALVGVNTGTATINVKNTGNGNLDTSVAQSISNLNGVIGASGSSVFQGTGTSLSLNDGQSTSTNYAFNPTTRGSTSTSIVTTFSNGNSSGNNLSQTLTSTLQGQGVAPVDGGVTGGSAGKILVGQTGSVGVTVSNTGDGNLSGLGSVSNLNGTLGAVSSNGFSGGAFGVSQSDSTNVTYSYTFAPTVRGTASTGVNANFSNGDPSGGNASHTATTAVSGQGVAPLEAMAGSNAGFVLVGQSASTGVVVTNSGDGNQSGLGSISNLNGTVSGPSPSTQFGGPSPNPNPLSLTDTSSTTVNYQFAPTVRGSASATVTGNFSNGKADGTNASHTNTATVAGVGVAPVANADTSADAGFVLVGQTGSMGVTITNSGDGNKSGLGSISNLNGSAGSAGGQFGGPSPNPNPLSLTDTSSTTVNYQFAPTIRGADSTTVTHNFSNGSQDNKNLATSLTTVLNGQGVAPVEGMTGGGAGFTLVGTSHTAAVTVANTGDGNLSGLGSISNLNGSVSGPSPGGQFSGPSPNPNPLSLQDTSSTGVTYVFAPTTRGGDSATVTGTFSNGAPDNTNSAHTNTALVTGQGVAPIQSTGTSASAGFVLVGTSKNLSFTVANTGDGNLDTSVPTSVSNLNGVVGTPVGSAQFGGPSPNPNPISLNDTSSTAVTFQFAPTLRGADSSTVTTNYSNGNASGNNAADSATTTLTGQGVAPINKVTSGSPIYARVGGTTATTSVTITNTGDGNLSGLGSISNLNGSISGASGSNWAPPSANTFSIQDSTSSATPSNAFTFTYSSQAARGQSQAAGVTIGFTNGSTDGSNSSSSATPTLVGNTVGPVYQSKWHGKDNTAGARNAGPATTSTINWGTVSKFGTFSELLFIKNITTDQNGGDATLTDLSIESFSITGDKNFTIGGSQGPFGDVVPSVLVKGGSEFLQIDFNAAGLTGIFNGLLTLQTDEDTIFGGLGNTYSYNLLADAETHIPEPSSLLMLGFGLGGALFVRRRRANARKSGQDAS